MDPHTWLIYFAAALGLAVSPGPNSLLVLTHGALHGWRAALATVLGGTLGFVLVIGLSTFGIGALLASSVVGLTVLKWTGGAYLVWLGVQVWRAPPIELRMPGGPADARPPAPSPAVLFRQGLLAASTNPKGILFFVAFLPQFIDPARSLVLQFLVLAGTFAVIEIVTEVSLASVAHRVSGWLARAGRRFNHACGGIFIAIGLVLPWRG